MLGACGLPHLPSNTGPVKELRVSRIVVVRARRRDLPYVAPVKLSHTLLVVQPTRQVSDSPVTLDGAVTLDSAFSTTHFPGSGEYVGYLCTRM